MSYTPTLRDRDSVVSVTTSRCISLGFRTDTPAEEVMSDIPLIMGVAREVFGDHPYIQNILPTDKNSLSDYLYLIALDVQKKLGWLESGVRNQLPLT